VFQVCRCFSVGSGGWVGGDASVFEFGPVGTAVVEQVLLVGF